MHSAVIHASRITFCGLISAVAQIREIADGKGENTTEWIVASRVYMHAETRSVCVRTYICVRYTLAAGS